MGENNDKIKGSFWNENLKRNAQTYCFERRSKIEYEIYCVNQMFKTQTYHMRGRVCTKQL